MKKTAMLIGLAAVLGFSSNAQAVDWNWKGDLRYRYQSKMKDLNTSATDHSTDLHRIRVRIGADMWINEELSSGFEIRTGDDATSANSTLADGFAGDQISLSEAYINYHPMVLNGDVNVLMGKRYSNKTLTVIDDLIWDGDVTLEGITLQYGKDEKGKEKDGLSANTGCYIYDGNTTTKIFVGQASYKSELFGLDYQVGSSYYDYQNYEASTTTLGGSAVVLAAANRDYNIVEFFGNVGGKVSSLPWKVYGQYAFNAAKHSEYSAITDSERDAYLVGLKLGKAKNPGQLEGSVEYYRMENDAVNPNVSDSDRGDAIGSKSYNVKGWKLSSKYALIQNMDLGLTYFNEEKINATGTAADDRGHLLQADVVVKF